MGFRKRIRKKVHNYFKKAGGGIQRFGKRFGQKVTQGYKDYKDPIIVGGAMALGAILGSVVPGVGTIAGATFAGSLASGAVGYYRQRQQQQAVQGSIEELNSSEVGYGADPRRRRNLFRGVGEGIASYSSENAPGAGEYERVA